MKLFLPLRWLCLFLSVTAFIPLKPGFEETQKVFARVRQVYERKEDLFAMKCRSKEIPENFGNMYIRVFKQEQILEVWVQDINKKYVLFSEHKVYAMSGHLGPKRQQGDAQVPEGFYHIREFNPVSNYHLSLGINYPNNSDRMLSKAADKGGDIFIHGGRVSAGCVAMSDYYIEDIYLAAVKAHNQGQQNIPVHIFPFKMTRINMEYYSMVGSLQQHIPFWKNLAQGYSYFELNKQVPEVEVTANGSYEFSNPSTASN